MPRRVDHDERRRQLTDALARITATRGLDAVSLREVAAEAGVSMGAVQHYFATKDEMLLFAIERMQERVLDRIACVRNGPTYGETIRAILLELLPLDQTRRTEARIYQAFLARAAVAPALATRLRETLTQFEENIALTIRASQALGQSPPGLDPEREATALLAVVDGLTAHALIELQTPETVLAALDTQLSRLFKTVSAPSSSG
jgi:TetR/AcrR family transcriptional regulator, transcriptional repressor of bet genes